VKDPPRIVAFQGIPWREDNGTWGGQALEFPGAITVGRTRAEVQGRLREAVEGYLPALVED
jgi:predicted RNase H-like HicB family nuclease